MQSVFTQNSLTSLFLAALIAVANVAVEEDDVIVDQVNSMQEHAARAAFGRAERWAFEFDARVGFAATDFMHLQQDAHALRVSLSSELSGLSSELQPGTFVRVTGWSKPNGESLVKSIEVLETQGRLEAKPFPISDHAMQRQRHFYSAVEGRVIQVVRKQEATQVCLMVRGEEVYVDIATPLLTQDILPWFQNKVHIEGTLQIRGEKRRPVLKVQTLSQIGPVDGVEKQNASLQFKHLDNAHVLFSDHKSKLIVGHRDLDSPVIVRSRFAKDFSIRDIVSLYLQGFSGDKKSGRGLAQFRARLIEDCGETAEVPVNRVGSLAEAHMQSNGKGLLEISGTLIAHQSGQFIVDAVDGRFVAQNVMFHGISELRPMEGCRVSVSGVPVWKSVPDSEGSGNGESPELTLLVPDNDHIRIESTPIRVSRGWIAAIAGTIGLFAFVGVVWNRSLTHQVNVRNDRINVTDGHLATSFEAVREAILLSDEHDRVVRDNTQFVSLFGFRPEVGGPLSECMEKLEDLFDDAREFRRICESTSVANAATENELSMGGQTVQIYHNEVRDSNQRNVGRLWSFYNCTEQRRLEQELHQSQKMEAIGQLSGGVAHDFNNLLTVISSTASVINMEATDAGLDINPLADRIDSAVGLAADLTRQMLDFARHSRLEVRAVEVNQLVGEVYDMARRVIDASIDLSLIMHPEPLIVRADSSRFVQVLLNLCINARDAIENDHGSIRIRTYLEASNATTRRVCIEVEDDGIGMSKGVHQRIFDPFFTTKPRQSGTGLGLRRRLESSSSMAATSNVRRSNRRAQRFGFTYRYPKALSYCLLRICIDVQR